MGGKPSALDAAKALMIKDKEERVNRFQQRLEALLKEERCQLNFQIALNGMTLVPKLNVTALD